MDAVRLSRYGGLLLSLLLAGSLQAAYVDTLRFVGNEVTNEQILRQEMWLSEGDALDDGLLERSRQAIMNLGLFRSVDARVVEEEGRTVVVITVEERYYLLPIPLLGARPEGEEVSYGFELRYDNLLGLNQRLKLSLEHKRKLDSEERMLREWELDYRYPRLLGSRNNLALQARLRSQVFELDDTVEEAGGYERDQYLFRGRVTRWLGARGVSEGWQAGGGLNLLQQRYTEQWGRGLDYHDGQALELQLSLGHQRLAKHPYYTEGHSYDYTLSHSLNGLGSDFSYTRHLFTFSHYRPLSWVDANLDTRLRFGLARGSSFDSPAYSLGGGSLRGYQEVIGEGNAMLLLNLEYQHRISGYRQLRAVLFGDVGSVWDGVEDISLDGFHPALGVGLRWRVQRFVDTTVRMDYGYGLREGSQRFYFSTSAFF